MGLGRAGRAGKLVRLVGLVKLVRLLAADSTGRFFQSIHHHR